MAKLKDGIFGGFSGKIGNVVGVRTKRGLILRSEPIPNNPQTVPQQANRNGFALINKQLTGILPFIKQGYMNVAVGDPLDRAKSVNLRSARGKENGTEFINYPFLKVSEGDLVPAAGAAASLDAADNLVFTWSDNSVQGNAGASDRVMLLAICPTHHHADYSLQGAIREAGQDSLVIPPALKHEEWFGYISFVSANGKVVSDSVYVEVSVG